MPIHEIKCNRFSLKIDAENIKYAVVLKNSETWTITKKPYVCFSSGKIVEFPQPKEIKITKTGTYDGVRAYYDIPQTEISVMTHVYVDATTEDIIFELRVDGDKKGEIETVSYPAPFDFGAKAGEGYTVLPRMQGTLVPAGTRIKIAIGDIFGRDAYMPLYGQVRNGAGYAAIFDTPYDAKYQLDEDRVVPLFRPSLGKMSYIRKMIFRFRDPCDYNVIAKCYRAYVKENGKLVTLKEKVAKNPNVQNLFGCPIIHTGICRNVMPTCDKYDKEHPENNHSCVPFSQRAEELKALKAKGLEKAYTHFDGWGVRGYDNLHPSPFPPNEEAGGTEGMRKLSETTRELGYIFGVHDQYRDYYLDGPDFSYDEATLKIDGTYPRKTYWAGGVHSYLCSTRAVDYVRRNYAEFDKLKIKIDAAYLDVFSVADLDENFSPDHPTTREQCARDRMHCFDILTDRGIIPSSEEIMDCVLPSMVLCHHAPYYTSSLSDKTSAESRGIPIPLTNLVYHDCVVIPWIGLKGQFGGFGISGKDGAYTHAILNGDPVYCPIDATAEQLEQVKFACESAEKLALCEMVKHEFLSDDYRRQRTTFSDGTMVEVNFDTNEYVIKQI
ncbi:MAG: hypothetical protein IJR55_05190 [Clostridia bacterium]|nr:hypothetical protein [Clostridia bacterium]